MISPGEKRRTSFLSGVGVFVLCIEVFGANDVPKIQSKLFHVATIKRDDLRGVNSAAVSKDGKFLYSSSWQVGSVNVFRRDEETGELSHVQTMASERDLRGVTSIGLSPDGRHAVATAFQSRTTVLFRVDPESGRLGIADVSRNDEYGVRGLTWAIAAGFSPDSRFVYALDPKASGASKDPSGAVTVFRVTENSKLRWIESNRGVGGCFGGVRGISFHPELNVVFITCSSAGTLVAASRDEQSGKLKVVQVVKDEEEGVHGLAGAMTCACSPDGKFVYTSYGRFLGDNAVGAYHVMQNGAVNLIQEVFAGFSGMRNFLGGNVIQVTPDGRNVYAAATVSNSLACFQRNLDTGELTYIETIADGTKTGGRLGAAGVAISPDSNFVYVTVEDAGAISTYRRTTVAKGD